MTDTILFTRQDHLATITFNRPKAMNTFNEQMAVELAAITESVKNDQAIRAVVINGAGHLFMAGGDVQFFYKSLEQMPHGVDRLVGLLHQSIDNIITMPKPVLASVHGSVAGAGVSLMLACDLVVATDVTKFTTAYSGIGLSPDGGATYFLPRAVGRKVAMQWLMLSDIFTAEEALTHGLINWMVAPDMLAIKTEQIIRKLVQGPTQSLAHIKKLVNGTWDKTLEEQLQREQEAFISCTTTQDFKTGVTAFIEKKPAEFIGK